MCTLACVFESHTRETRALGLKFENLSPNTINVRRCGGLSMVLLQLKDPLELFVKRREFLPGSRFLSCRNMTQADESDVKPKTFLPLNGPVAVNVNVVTCTLVLVLHYVAYLW